MIRILRFKLKPEWSKIPKKKINTPLGLTGVEGILGNYKDVLKTTFLFEYEHKSRKLISVDPLDSIWHGIFTPIDFINTDNKNRYSYVVEKEYTRRIASHWCLIRHRITLGMPVLRKKYEIHNRIQWYWSEQNQIDDLNEETNFQYFDSAVIALDMVDDKKYKYVIEAFPNYRKIKSKNTFSKSMKIISKKMKKPRSVLSKRIIGYEKLKNSYDFYDMEIIGEKLLEMKYEFLQEDKFSIDEYFKIYLNQFLNLYCFNSIKNKKEPDKIQREFAFLMILDSLGIYTKNKKLENFIST